LHRLTTRAVAHGSVLAASGSAGQAALEKLLKTYNKETGNKSLFTELRNLSDLETIQPVLNRCGFVYEDHLNYLIDLRRSEEEVFGAIASRTRSYIRRALRQENLEIKEINDRESLRTSYDLLKLTYQNAQVPLSDFSLFESAYDLLRPHDMVRFSAVFLEQTPIAVSIDLVYKDVVYYWYGGMDRAYSKQHPNELLRWHVIQWGIQNGFGIFDFGGAGKPDEKYGVRDFKAKFGGELVSYGRNICQHSPRLLRLSTFGYGVARRFI
jgi:lipid II:glycine glycyltransferase (peptidoglycan interpeptide bridge formation enzyme)